jgi:WD40 repeat-containing protein SMU1
MSTIEINSTDVIRLIQQYLKENGLFQSIKVLEEETGVKLNSVDSIEDLKNNIIKGKWDLALKALYGLDIEIGKLVSLYEQIIYELNDLKEYDIARSLLYDNLHTFKGGNECEYNRLEQIINSGKTLTEKDKERNRVMLAETLSKELAVIVPNRLTFLLTQGIKNLYTNKEIPNNITKYDIFTGRVDSLLDNSSSFVKGLYNQITFNDGSYVEIAKFSSDGNYLATGSSDGFIEIWDPLTGKLKSELTYQFENILMLHKTSVTSLNFSKDSKMLCSGDISGNIKIFKVANGKCLREFESAHSNAITSLLFSKDNSIIISGSMDSKVKLFGLKTGKIIKELVGHTSFINDLASTWNNDRFYSASSDGTINIWSFKNQDQIGTITLPVTSYMVELSINNIVINPKNHEQIYVSNKSNTVYLLTINEGLVVKTFTTEKDKNIIFISLSPEGNWLYMVDEENILYAYSVENNIMRNMFKIHEKDVIAIQHHPTMNMLISYALDSKLNIYC